MGKNTYHFPSEAMEWPAFGSSSFTGALPLPSWTQPLEAKFHWKFFSTPDFDIECHARIHVKDESHRRSLDQAGAILHFFFFSLRYFQICFRGSFNTLSCLYMEKYNSLLFYHQQKYHMIHHSPQYTGALFYISSELPTWRTFSSMAFASSRS